MKTSTFESVRQSDRYRESGLELANRSAAVAERTRERLHDVQAEHDLTWRFLLASQRKISRLAADDAAPGGQAFWEREALPRANTLGRAAIAVIDDEFAPMSSDAARFWESIEPLLTTDEQRRHAASDLRRHLAPLRSCTLDARPINDIGKKWQERLRRQATRRCLRSHPQLPPDRFSEKVDEEELAMLSQAPWLHADRLLTAFELARSDVRRALDAHVDALVAHTTTPHPTDNGRK